MLRRASERRRPLFNDRTYKHFTPNGVKPRLQLWYQSITSAYQNREQTEVYSTFWNFPGFWAELTMAARKIT
jgi:hypothetical protein